MRFPDLSNCEGRPSRAGGSPFVLEISVQRAQSQTKSKAESCALSLIVGLLMPYKLQAFSYISTTANLCLRYLDSDQSATFVLNM